MSTVHMRTGSELCFLTVSELGSLIRGREVSPVEVVEAHLARILDLNDKLRSYITVAADEARTASRTAENEIRNAAYRGPLHGIPVALKDIFHVRGLPTTAHSHVMDGYVASEDCTVAARLRAGGAIILGKLNTTEFASGDMPIYGHARNPWDTNRTAGISSSGSGVALAAGLTTLAFGSDTGGSGRQPAALCGVVALRPTYGLVSKAGLIPLSWSLDHVAPMARTVRDVALLLQAIAGYDPGDPSSVEVPLPDYMAGLREDLRGVRLGVPTSFFFEGTDPEVEAAVHGAIEAMCKLGARVEPVDLPHAHFGHYASWTIAYPEAYAYHRKNFLTRPEQYGRTFLRKITSAAFLTGEEVVTARRVRHVITREFVDALRSVDAIITPTMAYPAHRIDHAGRPAENLDRFLFGARLTRPVSLTGLPALAVPCGFTRAGLPVGLQIVGRAWEEAMVLRIGHAYEQATEWHTRRPPLSAVPVSSGPDGEAAQPDVRAIDPEEVHASWVLTNARLHELTYVTEADAEAIAAGLRPVKRGLALAREALGERWELATRPAVSR